MLGAFWSSVGGKLADRWATIGVPALVFWAGAVLAWTLTGGGPSRLTEAAAWLDQQSTPVQITVLLGALLVVVASVVLVGRLTTPTLRLLEGYWPKWADSYRHKIITKRREEADKAAERRRQLKSERHKDGSLDAADSDELRRLAIGRHRLPYDLDELMPTRTGNILRAAETRPRHKYGLDGVIVWPRLWLVMPDVGRLELATARGSLDSAVAAAIWGILFAVLIPLSLPVPGLLTEWSWNLPLVGLAAAVSGVVVAGAAIRWWVPARAEVFGVLVESSYDLYRTALYEQLRWPLPECPQQELEAGSKVTSYLRRGSDGTYPRFTNPT